MRIIKVAKFTKKLLLKTGGDFLQGPYHDFFICESNKDINSFLGKKSDFRIDDDLFRYFSDFFQWIKIYNPSTKVYSYNFNYWGISIIEKNDCKSLLEILLGLEKIFLVAPVNFSLNVGYEFIDKKKNGEYIYIQYEKEYILKIIMNLIEYCNIVLNSEEEIAILHFGI